MERTIWAPRNPQNLLTQAESAAGLCLEETPPTGSEGGFSCAGAEPMGPRDGREWGPRPFSPHRAWRVAGSAAPWSNHLPFLPPWFKFPFCPTAEAEHLWSFMPLHKASVFFDCQLEQRIFSLLRVFRKSRTESL